MKEFKKSSLLALFQAYGIEIEYMIVDKNTLEICPFTDKLFQKINGEISNEIDRGEIALNNELALHVLELKTNGPKSNLSKVVEAFHQEILAINHILESEQKVLMPSAMHPWTKVDQIELWPHDDKTIYNTYDKIFGCQGHGWSNLQSTHLNLPFSNEHEFVKLHQAIRLILPIIPMLAASSPLCEGQSTGYTCARMVHYENNQKKVPMITGYVIPESIKTQDDYIHKILEPMYEAIKAYDEDNVLRYEWLNSRGAIARFDRNAIEIRVIDSQECPLADIAVVSAIVAAIKRVIRIDASYISQPIDEKELKTILDEAILNGMRSKITNTHYLEHLGFNAHQVNTGQDLWREIISQETDLIPEVFHIPLQFILEHGSLSERISKALPESFTREQLVAIYTDLIGCLKDNRLYVC